MNLNPKLRNGGLGGALSVLVLWLLSGPLGLDLPTDVVAAIPVVIMFIVGYATSQGAWASNSSN